MTQIDFHVNAPSKLNYACRLARKAYGSGARLVVHADDEQTLAEFDRMLWTFSSMDFVPHVRVSDRLAAVTPVHLAGPSDLEACVHHELIVNLGRAQPTLFGRFERLIEIVGADEADLEAGRARWKFYKDRGYPLARHDVGAAPA